MDLPNVQFEVRTITLTFNVFIGVALALTIGPLGIVIATVLAETLKYIMSMRHVVRRVDGINIVPKPLMKQVISGVVMFLVVESSQGRVAVQSWIDLGFIISLGAVVYGICLFIISPGLRFTARAVYRDAIAE
jgi:peptidoglycan biosynthesis protein MviN/MurJ (putative lipid II flippase)